MIAALAVLVMGNAHAALDAAVACYEELDYACAEERLAEALAGGLDGPQRERARLYEALLATAFRDLPRARRAVGALLDMDPLYDPGPSIPPTLRELIESLRPEPVPPPAPLARADFASVQLSGQDAEQWTVGLGGELGGGVSLLGWLTVDGTLGYSNHGPAEFGFESLDVLYGAVGTGWRGALGPLRAAVGVSVGVAYADADYGVLGESTDWGATAGVPIDLAWPLWNGLGVGVRATPKTFVTSEEDNFAASFLLPLAVGVRYGR